MKRATTTNLRRRPKPDRRRALELLAGSPQEGCSEAIMLAHVPRSWSSWCGPGWPPRRRSASLLAASGWKWRRCGSRMRGGERWQG
jgi:hypothetical protein